MEKYSVTTIRMPENTDAVRVHQFMFAQERDTLCGVTQHLAHECVTAQQTIAHLVEMLCNILCFICLCASAVSATVFETDRVRSEHNQLLSGQSRSECLQGITDQAANFTLAKMSLAVMLMMD